MVKVDIDPIWAGRLFYVSMLFSGGGAVIEAIRRYFGPAVPLEPNTRPRFLGCSQPIEHQFGQGCAVVLFGLLCAWVLEAMNRDE